MSNYFDLTEDISSDDSISVDGCPEPKRWRMSAASSTGASAAAVSRHSNDTGGELGDDDVKWKVVDLTGDDSSDDGSSVNDVASSTGAAAAAFSRRSNDSGNERRDDDGEGRSSTIGGSGGDGEANGGWDLTKIFTLNELKKSKPIMCSNEDCDLVACSRWESTEGGKPWDSCLDCQAADYDGWPDELPVDHMTKEHRQFIIEMCSNPEVNPNPAMPELPLEDNASRHRNLIERAAFEYVHQPTNMPNLVRLTTSSQWKEQIDYVMSEESFSIAGPGYGRIDKRSADDKKFRILRTFVRDENGEFNDPDLEENAPLVYAYVKILLEVYDLTDVAFQRMKGQPFHCDPHARLADSDEKHCLLTLGGPHALAFSTSDMIQSPSDRYRTWSGGCGSIKVEPKNLRDIFIMPRVGDTPLMIIDQSILAGGTNGIILHAGLAISGEDGNHWMTSQSLVNTLADGDRAFRARDGDGTIMSTCLLGNILGSKEEAGIAFESAATEVCRVLLDDCETPHEAYIPALIHIRDLNVFKECLSQGKISDLSFRARGYLSQAWREKHYNRSVAGGGSERGRMEEGSTKKKEHVAKIEAKGGCTLGRMAEGSTKKKEHVAKIEAKGGSVAGRMAEGSTKKKEHVALSEAKGGSVAGRMAEGSTKKKEHVAKIEAKGGSVAGRMAGTVLEDHRAKIDEGFKKSSELLFRLANGKKDQVHKWTVTSRYYTTSSIHTFSNGFDDQIKGIGKFEEHLLKNYVSDELTEDGKSALAEMKKNCIAREKARARSVRKKQRAN